MTEKSKIMAKKKKRERKCIRKMRCFSVIQTTPECVRDILESLVRWWDQWKIIKKSEKNDYLNKIDGKIDKLMWVFCKNRHVK